MDDGDFKLILIQYKSNFVTNELSPGIYTFIGILVAVCTTGDHGGTLKNKDDDISMKTKLILVQIDGYFGTLSFDERSFFNGLYVFAPYWAYKPSNEIHAGSPGVYTIDKILN